MIKIDVDFRAAAKMLDSLQRQIPYAAQSALNATAFDVQRRLKAEAAARLHRPTRYTLGAVRVDKATKQSLTARIYLSERKVAGASPADLLGHLFAGGGTRRPKRYETALRAQGLIGQGEQVVPGAGVRIDANGNIARSQLLQILRALAGQKPAASKRARRSALTGTIFWSTGLGNLHKGAWQQLPGRAGIRPLLLVIRAPSYAERVSFVGVAKQEIAKRWPINLQAAVQRAIATAR